MRFLVTVLAVVGALLGVPVPVLAQLPRPDVTSGVADELRASIFTTSFLRGDNSVSVVIGVEVDGIRVVTPAAPDRHLEVRYVVDPAATAVEGARVAALEDPELAARAAREGVRVFARVVLPIGSHTVRATVSDSATAQSVTVVHPFEVPNFIAEIVTMSDLTISGSRVRGVDVADDIDDHILPIVGRPATARRTFSRDEQLEVDAEIYQVESAVSPDQDVSPDQLSVSTTVATEDGRVVYNVVEFGQSELLPTSAYGYPHYTLIPIGRLEPGRYAIRVTASVDGVVTARRTIAITIVDSR